MDPLKKTGLFSGLKGLGKNFKAAVTGKHKHHEVSHTEPDSSFKVGAGPYSQKDIQSRETALVKQQKPHSEKLPAPTSKPEKGPEQQHKTLTKLIKGVVSLLTDVVVDKEQLRLASETKEQCKAHWKSCVSVEAKFKDQIKKLDDKIARKQKKIRDLEEKKSKAKPDKWGKIDQEILVIKGKIKTRTVERDQLAGQLANQQPVTAAAEQALSKARSDKNAVKQNGDGLVAFGVKFFTSVRDQHKLQKANTPSSDKAAAELQSFKQDHLVINTSDGQLQFNNLDLRLNRIEFEDRGGRKVPVVGLKHLRGSVVVPLPNGKPFNFDLNLEDVSITLDSGIGPILHQYVTASNPITAAGGMLFNLGSLFKGIYPREIAVNGRKIDATLTGFSPESAASMVQSGQATPDSIANTLFTALAFDISGRIENVDVRTSGNTDLKAQARGLHLDYSPDPTKKKQKGKTRRRLTVGANHAHVTLKKGFSFMEEVSTHLTPDNPVAKLTGSMLRQQSTEPSALREVSEDLTLSGDQFSVTIDRELERQKKKDKLSLTGSDTLTADVESLSLTNTGGVKLKANTKGLHALVTIEADQQLPETEELDDEELVDLDTSKTTFDTSFNSLSVELDAPEGLLPKQLMGQDFQLSGGAVLTAGRTKVTGLHQEGHTDVCAKDIHCDLTVSQPVKGQIGDYGLFLPGKMSAHASGSVSIDKTPTLTEITPSLTLGSQNNQHAYALINGEKLPLDLRAELSISKLAPQVFTNTNPETGDSSLTTVASSGEIFLKAPSLGPLQIDSLHLALTDEKTGSLTAKGIQLNLDQITGGGTVDQTDDEQQLSEPRLKLPWYYRALMGKKVAHVEASMSITDGELKMGQVGEMRLSFSDRPGANIFQRSLTGVLNLAVRLILPGLSRFKIKVHDSAGAERKPHIAFKIGPRKIELPFPIPVEAVSQERRTLSIAPLFQSRAGVLLMNKKLAEEVKAQLNEVRKHNPESIKALNELLLKSKGTSSYSPLVELVARQLPIQDVQKILKADPKKWPELSKTLLSWAETFLNIPELNAPATQLFAATGKPLNKETLDRLYQRALDDESSDMTGIGQMLEAQGETKKAEKCYIKSLEHDRGRLYANERLAFIKVSEYRSNPIHNHDKLIEGLTYYRKAWEQGSTSALDTLRKLETAQDKLLAREARLTVALIMQTKESSAKDFDDATQRLVSLIQENPAPSDPVTSKAMRLLQVRVQNGQKYFHTEDRALYKKYHKKLLELKKAAKKKGAIKISVEKAVDMGVKLAYGAYGMPQDLRLSKQLLGFAYANSKDKTAIKPHLDAMAAAAA